MIVLKNYSCLFIGKSHYELRPKTMFLRAAASLFICLVTLACAGEYKNDEPEPNLSEEEIEALCKETWDDVVEIIGDNFLEAHNPTDLEFLFDDIRGLEYVEDVASDDNNMFVKLKNGSVWSWLFNNYVSGSYEETGEGPRVKTQTFADECDSHSKLARAREIPHVMRKPKDEKVKVLIFNQTFKDMRNWDVKELYKCLKDTLEFEGFDVTCKDGNYNMDDFQNYDLVIIQTHGSCTPWRGIHYLLTSSAPTNSSEDCATVIEVRDGKKCEVVYKSISEERFKSMYSNNKLKERETFIFCAACSSLKRNDGLSNAFIQNWASGFVGYTDDVSVGYRAADSFFRSLIEDYTIYEAFERIPENYRHQTSYKDETGEIIRLNAVLRFICDSPDYCYAHDCPNDDHPHLIDMGDGVKWSCCNVGATSPRSIGQYYSWGETWTKQSYSSLDNYEVMHGVRFPSDISGTEHDVAWVSSSHSLRMPKASEFQSLLKICNMRWDDENQGALLISTINGNRLFIPAGGWIFHGENMGKNETGILWSAEREPSSAFSTFMQVINDRGNAKGQLAASRYSGHNVRGVVPQ